jgi:hypothetical protein
MFVRHALFVLKLLGSLNLAFAAGLPALSTIQIDCSVSGGTRG